MKKQAAVLGVLALMVGFVAGAFLFPRYEAADGAATLPPPTSAVSYTQLVNAAEAAYHQGDFARALELARQAIAQDPQRESAFVIWQQAAVAQAGNTYLEHLPPSRYRIDTLHFLANQVNGMHYFIIDVREPDEYAAGHIQGAVNIPLRELLHHMDELPQSKTTPILVYCHSQKRATHALVILRELGYTNVWNLEGGWAAYKEWIKNNPMPTPGPTATPTEEPPSC